MRGSPLMRLLIAMAFCAAVWTGAIYFFGKAVYPPAPWHLKETVR